MQVDLVIVYSEIVMNSKLQLENPISRALAIPGSDILPMLSFHDNVNRDIPNKRMQTLIKAHSVDCCVANLSNDDKYF